MNADDQADLNRLVNFAHATLLAIVDAAHVTGAPLHRALLLAVPGATPALVDACLLDCTVQIVR